MVLPVALTTLDELREQIGREVAVSEWFTVTQERIAKFAEATGDDQWIHVDAGRAARESPYGATIAHGFLTLSLIGTLLRDAIALEGVRMTVNYGSNRARFMAPVIAGSRIRGRFVVASVATNVGRASARRVGLKPDPHEASGQAVRVVWNVTVECELSAKPCCVAEWVVLYYR